MPKFLLDKIYPLQYEDSFIVSDIKRGYIYDNFGIDAMGYDPDRDYYFHLMDFTTNVNGEFREIDYNLNSYYSPIDPKMDELFLSTAEVLTFDKTVRPKHKNAPGDSKSIIYYIEKIAGSIKGVISR